MRTENLMPDDRPALAGIIPDAPVPGGFELFEDDAMIRVTGTGLWSVEVIDSLFADLTSAIRRMRDRTGGSRVLVDLRHSVAQAEDVSDRLGWWIGRAYAPGDRVAVVVASCTVKVQMRRLNNSATRELFLSADAARLWLMA